MPDSSYKSQCRILRLGVCIVILALIGYIGWLQLAENEEMNHWSERQQKRLNYVPGKRGAIVDRNGVPLNYDTATYAIAIHIERLRDPRDTRTKFPLPSPNLPLCSVRTHIAHALLPATSSVMSSNPPPCRSSYGIIRRKKCWPNSRSNGIVFQPRILSCHGNVSIPMKPSPRRSEATGGRINLRWRILPCGCLISRNSSERAALSLPAMISYEVRTATNFSRLMSSPTGMKRSKQKKPCPVRMSR